MNKPDTKKYITKNFSSLIKSAQIVLETEIAALKSLNERFNDDFVAACELLLHCKGRTIILGMGKSGHIARKIAATLASTGTPAFFVHPGEANHGDMGMITRNDVVLAISYSGETPEILSLLPLIKSQGIPLIALCGKPKSNLARQANLLLDVSVKKEACPLGLAPTASTTATLVMGDALAIALLESRQFTADDFARFHPGGSLGRRLLMRTEDIMRRGEQLPKVNINVMLGAALLEITQKALGMTLVVDAQEKLIGIFTDGDLRRTLDQAIDIHQTPIQSVMTKDPVTILPQMLAFDALKIMESKKITALPVVDAEGKALGVIHMHDLLRAGVIT